MRVVGITGETGYHRDVGFGGLPPAGKITKWQFIDPEPPPDARPQRLVCAARAAGEGAGGAISLVQLVQLVARNGNSSVKERGRKKVRSGELGPIGHASRRGNFDAGRCSLRAVSLGPSHRVEKLSACQAECPPV